MAETEEGFNFKSAFKGTFGSIEGTQERLKAERRAGLTPKQRAKEGATQEAGEFPRNGRDPRADQGPGRAPRCRASPM